MAFASSVRCPAPSAAGILPSFASISGRSSGLRLERQLFGKSIRSSSANAPVKSAWRSVRSSYVCALISLAEAESVDVNTDALGKLPAAQGIYAVYDKEGELQFVGLSRRISASVQAHAKDLPDLCGSVKVAIIEDADRDGLRQAWKAWIEEHVRETGTAPAGNAPGNSTWTARKKAKTDIKMMPSRDKELTLPLEDLIDKLVKSYGVVAFIKGSRTAPQCGFSHRVLTILEELGVEYETVNVLDEDHNYGVREAIKTYSQWPTIPQVFVKGEFVGGADVMTEMAASGELKKLLAELKA